MQCRKVAEATAIGTSRAGGVCIVLGRSSRAARDAGSERHGRADPCTPSMGVASCREVTAHTTACMQSQTRLKLSTRYSAATSTVPRCSCRSTAQHVSPGLFCTLNSSSAAPSAAAGVDVEPLKGIHVAWLYTRTKESGPVCCIRKLSSAEPCRDGTLGVAAWTQYGPEGLCAACNDHPAQRHSAVSENATRDAL
jgi:hypothetical protein